MPSPLPSPPPTTPRSRLDLSSPQTQQVLLLGGAASGMLSLLVLCLAALRSWLLPASRGLRSRRRQGHQALKTTDDDDDEEYQEEEGADMLTSEPAHAEPPHAEPPQAEPPQAERTGVAESTASHAGQSSHAPKEELVGQRVTVFGLVSQPELNGRTGVAVRFLPEHQRYAVIMAGGKEVAIRAANIRVTERVIRGEEEAPQPQFRYH